MSATNTQFFLVPSSVEGKSLLSTPFQFWGVHFIAGATHADGHEDFAAAMHEAHDIEACLPRLHDTVQQATGNSLSDDALRKLLLTLPEGIKEQIDEWGLADTGVLQQIFAHIVQRGQ